MSVNWWILGPVLGFELGCAVFLFSRFIAFERDPYQKDLARRRAELRMSKRYTGKGSHYVG